MDGVVFKKSLPKVIFLDDDQMTRDLFHEVLRDEFEIFTTASTEMANNLCDTQDISVVMTDHHMGEITGVQFLKSLYQRYPHIRRVLITGDKSSNLIVDAVQKGHIHGIFYKPLDFQKLKTELYEHVERYEEFTENYSRREELENEVSRLREELYLKNAKIHETFSILRGDPKDQEFANLKNRILEVFNNHINSILDLLDIDIVGYNFKELQNILQEMTLISEEFEMTCLEVWISTIELGIELFHTAENSNLNSRLLTLENKIEQLNNTICKNQLKDYLNSAVHISVMKDLEDKNTIHNWLLNMFESLKNRLHLLIDIEKPRNNLLQKNLGYIMVVINQTTAYSKKFNAKTQINPALIGNMAIAINDFSKELFNEFQGVQSVKQNNGNLLIHRADNDIYYIAMTYKDSSYYKIWLQKFASRTLEFFKSRMDRLTFASDEIKNIDGIMTEITGF